MGDVEERGREVDAAGLPAHGCERLVGEVGGRGQRQRARVDEMVDRARRQVGRRRGVEAALAPVMREGGAEDVARADLEHAGGSISGHRDGVATRPVDGRARAATLDHDHVGRVQGENGLACGRPLLARRPLRLPSFRTTARASARDPLARNGTTSSPCGSWTARSADTTASPSTKPKRSTTRPSTERAGCRVGTPGRSVAGDRAWK
ncbi:hypothetical protein GCM10025880_10310 [Methylorubrum aminovorans]|nr:hypothetical protein GCM10025880_10310 [Methylorubrum aminovorans]